MRRFVLASIAALTFASAAWAQQPPAPPERPPHPHEIIEQHAEALGIDGDTVAEIQRVAEDSRASMERCQQQVQQARQALAESLQAEQPDRAAVMAAADALGAAETEQMKQRLGTLLDMHGLLTPAQIDAIEAMIPEGPPGGPPGGGPPPPHGAPPPGMPGAPQPGL